MTVTADFLVIGSGLTGATIARTLADAGREVFVVERRNHLGGNVHDHLHPSGIRIHTYGPHYFRTNSNEIWQFVNRFSEFVKYEAVVATQVNGRLENWPITADYIRREVGEDWRPSFNGIPSNFEEACLAMMPRLIYERFVKGYTEKQWGVRAPSLSAQLASRFEVRKDNDPRFCKHKHQGIPRGGYAEFARRLMSGIPFVLNCDYTRLRNAFRAKKLLIFTGGIDDFFDHDLGRLTYRAQHRQHVFLPTTGYAQPCGQVNNASPENGTHIRTLEWKHMMPFEQRARITGSVLTTEHPYTAQDPNDYEYPFPDQQNLMLYQAYRSRAARLENVLICGRLGEYRYLDMDQAIGKALGLARKILNSSLPASQPVLANPSSKTAGPHRPTPVLAWRTAATPRSGRTLHSRKVYSSA
jgi:UDP-galactopyranose mutase